MADHTITVSNAFNAFGPAPSSLWGTMVWSNAGLGKWGEGSESTPFNIGKFLFETTTPSDALFKNSIKLMAEALSISSETTDEGLMDGSGYSYVFISNVSDADDRASTTYTEAAAAGTSWSTSTVAVTTWS